MRLTALLVTATLTAGTAVAQQPAQPPETSPASVAASPSQDDKNLNLPVSLAKIREALENPTPDLLKNLDERPTFRLEIQERQRIQALLDSIKFEKPAGPPPPGGIYAYEMQRQAFPAVDNPLAQPYAAFNQGELLTLGIEALIQKYIATRVVHAIGEAMREQAEREAREEVQRALAEFWAARNVK